MDEKTLRQVQLTELEIAKEIRRVCREHSIPYVLYRGTFLGAVRHQGFIPWDDDMDVAMLREDYDRFCAIAPKALGADYCFQNWHTDENYAHPFGKVRKRGTLFVEAKCKRLSENGIYVDVYPLDAAPEGEPERKRLAWKLLQLYRLKLMKSGYTPWMEGSRIVWRKRIGYLLYQTIALLFSHKRLIALYEGTVRAIAPHGTVYEQSAMPVSFYFPEEQYRDRTPYPFEDTTFPGPRAYDANLSTLYGDYMVLPPEGKRENRHQIIAIDFGGKGERES